MDDEFDDESFSMRAPEEFVAMTVNFRDDVSASTGISKVEFENALNEMIATCTEPPTEDTQIVINGRSFRLKELAIVEISRESSP